MEKTISNKLHVLMWTAGIAVTAFSAVGIAAIMGWIPTSMGHGDDAVVAGVKTPHATGTARLRTEPLVAPRMKIAAAATPAHTMSAPPAKTMCAECGVVESVRPVNAKGSGTGAGAVGGAVVGGVVGNQIGHGTGRTVATVAGAVGGALAGNEIEKYVKSDKSYEIVVRLENGYTPVFHQATAPTWQAGDSVKIVNGVLQSNP